MKHLNMVHWVPIILLTTSHTNVVMICVICLDNCFLKKKYQHTKFTEYIDMTTGITNIHTFG